MISLGRWSVVPEQRLLVILSDLPGCPCTCTVTYGVNTGIYDYSALKYCGWPCGYRWSPMDVPMDHRRPLLLLLLLLLSSFVSSSARNDSQRTYKRARGDKSMKSRSNLNKFPVVGCRISPKVPKSLLIRHTNSKTGEPTKTRFPLYTDQSCCCYLPSDLDFIGKWPKKWNLAIFGTF